jgi:hypothetical protein
LAALFPYSRVNPSMHLVYLCGEYPPASHGGIGTFTRAMAHAMTARGHTVTVLGVQRGLTAVHDARDGLVRCYVSPRVRAACGRRGGGVGALAHARALGRALAAVHALADENSRALWSHASTSAS